MATRTAFLRLTCLIAWLPCIGAGDANASPVDDWVRSFAESQIVFQRATSNVPFPPLAFIDVSQYQDAKVRRPHADSISYDQTNVSQGAAVPFLLGPRDVFVVGDWLGWSRFDARSTAAESFDVLSVGVPVGLLHQGSRRWQSAEFIMPLGHKTNLDDSSWSWETLGGVFARYLQSDSLWWAFGLYADVKPGPDTYLPYLGVSWSIDDHWTLSAIMPWPAVMYAPTRDTLFRLGGAPSGASWSLRPNGDQAAFTLDSWDLGAAAEHRIHGNFWLAIEAGVGGLRTLRVTDGELREPDVSISHSPYISVGVRFRPALTHDR